MLVDINLLPEKEKERSTLLIAALVILGAAVLILGIFLFLSNGLVKETTNLEQQLESVQLSQEEIRSELQAMEFDNSKKQLESTVDWAENYQFDTVPLLNELIAFLPERGYFGTFDFTGPNFATISVQFDAKSDAAYYFTRMQSSKIISDVKLDTVTIEEFTEEDLDYSAEILPRFIATYSLQFVDNRTIVEGAVEASGEPETVEEGDGADD